MAVPAAPGETEPFPPFEAVSFEKTLFPSFSRFEYLSKTDPGAVTMLVGASDISSSSLFFKMGFASSKEIVLATLV